MNLGTYIDTLAALDPTLTVVFDNGRVPIGLSSWRGRYEELTLDSDSADQAEPPTVAALLTDAIEADGKTFQGYKGGDFVMSRRTAVWADEWGHYECWAIAGVEVGKGRAVIRRMNIEDYA